jgi:DNA-binding LytR/AlgR family response regulator
MQKERSLTDDFVNIRYRELTPVIHQIILLCEDDSAVLLAEKDEGICRIDINDIYYIEWVDRRSCICTADDVFTIDLPLTRLEESLRNRNFIRVSKMCMVNLFRIRSVSPRCCGKGLLLITYVLQFGLPLRA